jgi:hypothetical protein
LNAALEAPDDFAVVPAVPVAAVALVSALWKHPVTVTI